MKTSALFYGAVALTLASLTAETITLLESFEDNIENVFHSTDDPADNADTNRRIGRFEQTESNELEQITDGTKALKISFDSMRGWQRDFQVWLDPDATELVQEAVLSEDVGRYYLMYDITWDNAEGNAGWANSPMELGGWLYGDQIEWFGGNKVVTMAYELGAGTPEGFGLNLVGDKGDQTFVGFIFNANSDGPLDVYVDNLRLMDTRSAPNAEANIIIIDSFEEPSTTLTTLGRAEAVTLIEDENFVSHGSKSAKFVLGKDPGWAEDATLDLNHDTVFELLQLPQEQRFRYTLAWDWYAEPGDGASTSWFQQVLRPWASELQLTQGWGGAGSKRTRALNLGLMSWDEPPMITLIHNGGWSDGPMNIYVDNLRIVDNGFLPSLFSITESQATADGISLSWASAQGKNYEIHKAAKVDGPYQKVGDVAADGEKTTYTSTIDGSTGFFRVLNVPPAPAFEDDFESGLNGWTIEDLLGSGTTWERGTPATGQGPGTANSGNNVWGTDLNADYAFHTEIALRSPVIDLTSAPAATLYYWSYQDVEPLFEGSFVDFLDVRILSESGDDLLGAPLRRLAGVDAQWERKRLRLPAEAIGQRIRLEFRFTSDGFNAIDPDSGNEMTQAGWFIDDVVVMPE